MTYLDDERDRLTGPMSQALMAREAAPHVTFGKGSTTIEFDDIEPGADLIDDGAGQGGAGAPTSLEEHNANLAERIDAHDLKKIVQEILTMIDADIESRAEWHTRFKNGLKMLGISDDERTGGGAFAGASEVTHPLMLEAMTQFQSRAIAEMFPSTGPVKAAIFGKETDELRDQAERVEDYMNYQAIFEDEGYYEDTDALFMMLPFEGSVFRKIQRDTLNDRNSARMVRAADLIVPYSARSLADAPRYTHRIQTHRNDMLKSMRDGKYRRVQLVEPQPTLSEGDGGDDIESAIDDTEGRSESYAEHDEPHIVYEVHIDYDVPNFPDIGSDGQVTGVGLPYIISIERDSEEVLSIRRNWKFNDHDLKAKRIWFVHYKYLPGLGFYGLGLIHALAGLTRAATGAMRALLDAAAWATLQGGFRSKDAKVPAGEITMEPGVWVEVESTAEDLKNSFYTPPFKEPSPALFQMLQIIVESGRQFASTTEVMVGDAANTAPVGTTVALIEQGSKVYSAIHKRSHMSYGAEQRLLYALNAEFVPKEGFPYQIEGKSAVVYKQDFSEAVNVLPVSDPNFFSSTQRIASAQAAVELSEKAPQIYEIRAVHLRMLEALKVPQPEELLKKLTEAEPADPVSENMALLMGKPIRAFPHEEHAAHAQVHMEFMQHPGFGGNKMVKDVIAEKMISHIAEHMAFLYQQKMEMARVPTAEMDLFADDDQPMIQEPRQPNGQNMIARMAAEASATIREEAGVPEPRPLDDQGKAAREDQLAQAKIKRDEMVAQRGEERKDAAAGRDMERKDAVTHAESSRKTEAAFEDFKASTDELYAEMDRLDEEFRAKQDREYQAFLAEQQIDEAESRAKIARDDRETVADIVREDREAEADEDRADAESTAEIKRSDKVANAQAKAAASRPQPKSED